VAFAIWAVSYGLSLLNEPSWLSVMAGAAICGAWVTGVAMAIFMIGKPVVNDVYADWKRRFVRRTEKHETNSVPGDPGSPGSGDV
jgi:hypothetical protein